MTASPTTNSRPSDDLPPPVADSNEDRRSSLLSPRWILLHVLVFAAVLVMLRLGWWQLDRLSQRRATNETIEQRAEVPPVPLRTVIDGAGGDMDAVGATAEWQHVSLSGHYLIDDEVAVRNRSLDGAPGRWIVTPFATDDGDTVAVVRGFIPAGVDDTTSPFEDVEPPSGDLRIEGYVQPTQTRGRFGPVDPPDGHLDALARVDVARLDQQTEASLAPFWVQLSAQDPSTLSNEIAMVPLPPLDDGPHLGYAVQWAVFAMIAAVGYPLALWRRGRK